MTTFFFKSNFSSRPWPFYFELGSQSWYSPKIPQSLSLLAGSSVRWECDSVPQYEEVEWRVRPLDRSQEDRRSREGSLWLPLLTESDSGLYSCSASNTFGSVSRSVNLTVMVRYLILDTAWFSVVQCTLHIVHCTTYVPSWPLYQCTTKNPLLNFAFDVNSPLMGTGYRKFKFITRCWSCNQQIVPSFFQVCTRSSRSVQQKCAQEVCTKRRMML